MQETGSNITQSNNVLSIRLSSNGQYFSVSDDNSPVVRVTLDTDQVVLIPAELFKTELAESYLKINACPIEAGQCVVVSAEVEGIVAVMGWSGEQIDDLKSKYADRLEFYSPILDSIARKQTNSLSLILSENRLYVTLYNDKLEYAECLPCESSSDILYYIDNMKNLFGLEKRAIYIYGEQAKQLVRTVKQYYKRVVQGDK